MSVRVSIADLEAYLRRVRARLEEASAASDTLKTEVLNRALEPGSFSAAEAFSGMHRVRADEHDERLRDYVRSLEELEAAVQSIIANWEDADAATEADLDRSSAALGDSGTPAHYDSELS